MDQDSKGCLLAAVIPAVVMFVIGLIVLVVNKFNDDSWFTFMLLSLLLVIELVVGLVYLLMRQVKQGKQVLSEQARKTQAKRALILGFAVITTLIVVAVVTGLWKNQYVMVCFGLLAMPFIGAMLFSNMETGAKGSVITLAVVAALLFIFSTGNLSDPNTVTIVNGISSTDFSENLTSKLLLLVIVSFFYFWAGTLLSGAVLRLCAPKD